MPSRWACATTTSAMCSHGCEVGSEHVRRPGEWCCVGAEQNPGTDAGELLSRRQHQRGDATPIVALDGVRVSAQAMAVQRDVRVAMRTESGFALETQRVVASAARLPALQATIPTCGLSAHVRIRHRFDWCLGGRSSPRIPG